MSEADCRLLSEMFALVKNIDGRLSNLESSVDDGFKDINKRLDDQSEMIESNFVDHKEMQTVVEIHKADKKIHAL